MKPIGAPGWWITGVYGRQLDVAKLEFLQEIVDVRNLHAGPWTMVGDYNPLVNSENKSNDAINRRMISRFRMKLNYLELKEVYLNGRRYTWSNEREQATLEKIDHVFTTTSWEDLYPVCFLSVLGIAVLDHCPLLFGLHADFTVGRRFRFESFCTKAYGFLDMVVAAWALVPSTGNPFVVLDKKLRATTKHLQRWSDRWIESVKMQITIALELIHRLDVASDSSNLSRRKSGYGKVLRRKLLGLCSLERLIARQKSRLLWLREGDASTRIFHQHASNHRRRNTISILHNNGEIYTG